MGNDVFANGREVSCKAADGKSICAFPDVCFTPPENPATPPGVPIPYPNTGMAKDTTSGSKKVKVTKKEVMLKNKSYFKKSIGNEAGSAAKKGVVTSTNRGKVYFNSWSMDVKFEGENVVRHLDLTTHNHMSFPGNSPTWPFLDSVAFGGAGPCKDVAKKVKENCVDKTVKYESSSEVNRSESMKAMCADDGCKKAMACVVSPYSPNNCCPPDDPPTPHHIVPKSQFKKSGKSGFLDGISKETYDKVKSKGPCICAEGKSHSTGRHGEHHEETSTLTRAAKGDADGKISKDARWSLSNAEDVGAQAIENTTDDPKCKKECTKAQLEEGHKQCGVKQSDQLRPTAPGRKRKTNNTFT